MSQKLVESIYQAAKIVLVYALHCANKTMGLEFLILGSRLRSLGGSNAEFLILGTADMLSWAIHCCGDCLAPCEMFSTVAGLYPLEASCTLVLPLLRKHKCIQTWSNACGRQNCSWFGTKDPREARKMHIWRNLWNNLRVFLDFPEAIPMNPQLGTHACSSVWWSLLYSYLIYNYQIVKCVHLVS